MRDALKLLFWMSVAVLARVIPHAPNFSPYASLIMLMGAQLERRNAVMITLTSLILSDVLLALIFNYAIFGLWSLFTYSGFMVIALAAHCLQHHRSIAKISVFALSSTLIYWLWTNLGTWLVGNMYPHNLSGLGICFIAGLPFLQASLISVLIFVPLLFAAAIPFLLCHPRVGGDPLG